MAQRTRVELIDDIDGRRADETVDFILDGVSYEIDLSKENAETLREELRAYIENARRQAGRKLRATTGKAFRRTPGAQLAAARERNQRIRTWAKANDFYVSDIGRIPDRILAAFEKHEAEEPGADKSSKPRSRKRAG
ncbi:histone-like nucleoid-structuring protein Lsr2 [Amycolatopsis rubida]|uniref:Lsr2 protein n=1 Tax=Amycolatopsis rubida TaxID=112413 RepID=A0A1I5E3X3_9PSEU|nr:Lsr2 family protein [Amycolatopsis rubida]SFO06136.1 Lsr2 protein [Amycolatopsis rubida]